MSLKKIAELLVENPRLEGLPSGVLSKLMGLREGVAKKTGDLKEASDAMMLALSKAWRVTPDGWTKIRANEIEGGGLNSGWVEAPDEPWTINEETGIAMKPISFTREGVQGQGLKLREELKASAYSYNYVPVIYGSHPTEKAYTFDNGQYAGWLDEVKYDELPHPRLKGMVNVDLKDPEVPMFIKQMIRSNKMIRGVSPGFFGKWEPQNGHWKGKPYSSIERNMIGQHLLIGTPRPAMGLEDGVGLGLNTGDPSLRDNEDDKKMSDEERRLLNEKITRLEDAAKALETKATDAEAERDTAKEALGKYTELGEVEDLSTKLSEHETLTTERDAALEKERTDLITALVQATGKEATELDGWTIDQLGFMADQLKVPRPADSRGTAPTGRDNAPPPPGPVPGSEFDNPAYTVGNMTGEKQEMKAPPGSQSPKE